MYDLILKPSFGRLPAGKLLCLGRNYHLHAKEMGAEAPDEPVIFMKPRTAIVSGGGTVVRPAISNDMHHEVELVAVIGERMRSVAEEDAMRGIIGYAIGLDMTLRDLQSNAKKRGEPWTVAKGFDTSAPISEVIPAADVPDPHDLTLRLTVNGEIRQEGHTGAMIFRLPFVISYLSRIFTLEPGDCIFTGTPEGVGPVVPGDVMRAEIEGVVSMEARVA